MEEETINNYKEATGDWLLEDADQLQKFVQKQVNEQLRKTCDIQFEGNPRILTNVLHMHKSINKEKEERLFHFGPNEIETISIAEYNTHMLKTTIPERSYLLYNVDSDVDINEGWLGLNIDNIINFCRIGENEDNFRYRYDSKLNDFRIQFKGLTRKFSGMDPSYLQHFNISEISFKGKATVNLKELLNNILRPAYALDFDGIRLQLAYNQLNTYGCNQFDEEGTDILDDSIKAENWNGEIVTGYYTVPLIKQLVELLSKCFSVGEISFSDDDAMRISCGRLRGKDDDDLFLAELIVARRTDERDDIDDEEDEEDD